MLVSFPLPPHLEEARASGTVKMTLPEGVVRDTWRDNAPQRVGIAHLLTMRRMLLADATGTGKSPTTLIAWAILHKMKGWRALAIVQKSAVGQFAESAEFFIEGAKPTVYYGPPEKRARLRAEGLGNIVITTYGTALADRAELLQAFGGHIPVVLIDEAHRLRGWGPTPKERKTKEDTEFQRDGIQELTKDSEYVWLMTATPMGGRLDELAALAEVLYPGLFGGESGFIRRYTKRVLIRPKNGRPFYKRPTRAADYVNVSEFVNILKPLVLRRPVEAFSEILPAIDWRERIVDMDPKHQKLYDKVEGTKDLPAMLPASADRDEKFLSTLTKQQYTQMVSDAPAVLGFEGYTPAKALELLDLLKSELRNEPVLIYSRYATVARWLVAWLKSKHMPVLGAITGDESLKARDTLRKHFNTQRGRSAILVITDAGSESLDLQTARAVVLYTLPLALIALQQVIGRARRIGSPHSNVLVYVVGHATRSESKTRALLNTKTSLHNPLIKSLTVGDDKQPLRISPLVADIPVETHQGV